eukprot:TRINITY_DN10691_c0_g1_i2.p1 TRINITY_DN10691_c0_g1~~TRINITY_DN10691_c0_g1_i2.p1  ORF type:complete len:224 (+),score=31.15 TRINITY_DN10691_c0_g1_i2:112-783(+)
MCIRDRPTVVDQCISTPARSYRAEAAWRNCRLSACLNRGGCDPMPAYQRFYADSASRSMAPFEPRHEPVTTITITLRNNTMVPTRVKIKHQEMNADCVQALLQPLQTLKIKIPDCDEARGKTLRIKVKAEFDLNHSHENTFDWRPGESRQGPIALIQTGSPDKYSPHVVFYSTMSEVITEMEQSATSSGAVQGGAGDDTPRRNRRMLIDRMIDRKIESGVQQC